MNNLSSRKSCSALGHCLVFEFLFADLRFILHTNYSPTYLLYQFYTREKFGENIIETSQKMQNSSFSIPNNSDYYSNNTKVD